MEHKIIRLPIVKERTGLSRSTIYNKMADKSFPRSVQLGARAIGWYAADIDQWILNRVSASKNEVDA